jgi:hypothetical protein
MWVQRNLARKGPGEWSLGRLGKRGEDNIKMVHREMGDYGSGLESCRVAGFG